MVNNHTLFRVILLFTLCMLLFFYGLEVISEPDKMTYNKNIYVCESDPKVALFVYENNTGKPYVLTIGSHRYKVPTGAHAINIIDCLEEDDVQTLSFTLAAKESYEGNLDIYYEH